MDLYIKKLYLEVTRQCNLECRHCFRGENEDKFMPLDVIDIIFKNIDYISKLLLTGGEPLLAVNQLKRIAHNINSKNIDVGEIVIVTNGTILSDEVLEVLKYFSSVSDLEIDISSDKFHLEELNNKGLLDVKNKNIDKLREYFKIYEYLPKERPTNLIKTGRAKNITKNDLKKIDSLGEIKTKTFFTDGEDIKRAREKYELPHFTNLDGVIDGYLSIDVNGNIIPTFLSFKEEDENIIANVKKSKSLKMALTHVNNN